MDITDDEHFIDITDDEGYIPETYFEEFLDVTADGYIPETCFEEFLDVTNEGVDIHMYICEAWIENSLMTTMDDGDIPEANKDTSTGKVRTPEWIFLIINVLVELLSAAFDQLSSVKNPQYALIAMLMSVVAAITCIAELAYKAGKERVIWRWETKLPWFYHSSPSSRRFGTFPETIGLVCALLQTIISAVAYTFYHQHADYPLKVSFWPVVFALGLFGSKFL